MLYCEIGLVFCLLWFLSFLYPFVGICWRLALFSFLFSFWILSSLWLVSSTSIVWLVDQMYLLDHRGCWHLSTDGLRCAVVLIKLTIVWEMSKNVACVMIFDAACSWWRSCLCEWVAVFIQAWGISIYVLQKLGRTQSHNALDC